MMSKVLVGGGEEAADEFSGSLREIKLSFHGLINTYVVILHLLLLRMTAVESYPIPWKKNRECE